MTESIIATNCPAFRPAVAQHTGATVMSDVIELRPRPAPKPVTLQSVFGDDAYLLKWCADWRAARHQQEKNWAEHELATGWGHLESAGHELDRAPLELMEMIQGHIAECEPRTMLLAREMLGMCLTILVQQIEHPDHVMAQGPVVEMLRTVISSLEALDGRTLVGEAHLARGARQARRKRKE